MHACSGTQPSTQPSTQPEHATLAPGFPFKRENGDEHKSPHHAPPPPPALPQIRQQQSVVGAHPPPPAGSTCGEDLSARQHKQPPAQPQAGPHPYPPGLWNGSTHCGGSNSPRKHKPLKWTVVPTSMVMTNGAAYRPTHHDASAVARSGAATGVAASGAPTRVGGTGFTVSPPALATGVPLTGLRDSTLSEALPALATISRPGAIAAIVPSLPHGGLLQPPARAAAAATMRTDGLVGQTMPQHATPPMRRGGNERACERGNEGSVPSGTKPSPRRKHGLQAASPASPVPLFVDLYVASGVAIDPEVCGVAVDAQGQTLAEHHVACSGHAPNTTSTVTVGQLMVPPHHQRSAAL